MRGEFELIGGGNKVAVFFLDLAEQVMQFRSVFLPQQRRNGLASRFELTGDQVGERQIVAIVVGTGIDALGLFQVGDGVGDFSGLDV